MFVSETLKVVISGDDRKSIFIAREDNTSSTSVGYDKREIIDVLTKIANLENYSVFKTDNTTIDLSKFVDDVYLNISVDTFMKDNSIFVTHEDYYDFDNHYDNEFVMEVVEVALNSYGYEILLSSSPINEKENDQKKVRLVSDLDSFATYTRNVSDDEILSILLSAAEFSGYGVKKNEKIKYKQTTITGLIDINLFNNSSLSGLTYTDEFGQVVEDKNSPLVEELLRIALCYLDYELITRK